MKKIKLILNTLACFAVIGTATMNAQSETKELKKDRTERSSQMKDEVKGLRSEIDVIRKDERLTESEKRTMIHEKREAFHKSMRTKYGQDHPMKARRAKGKKAMARKRGAKVEANNFRKKDLKGKHQGGKKHLKGQKAQSRRAGAMNRKGSRAELTPTERSNALARLAEKENKLKAMKKSGKITDEVYKERLARIYKVRTHLTK